MSAHYHWLGAAAEPRTDCPTVADIQVATAAYFNISALEMRSQRRADARPRQIAMYIARHITVRSLSAIGGRFGARDHSTVFHAVNRIEKLRATDREIDDAVTSIMAEMAG